MNGESFLVAVSVATGFIFGAAAMWAWMSRRRKPPAVEYPPAEEPPPIRVPFVDPKVPKGGTARAIVRAAGKVRRG